eukprot:c39083_g1_i1.p1 GENE.c39083_g1_i1~~c39083_g1_i1.p1  ORF type:complete len:371 (+),score=73.14 c39083_g1_i1:41-1153(+)
MDLVLALPDVSALRAVPMARPQPGPGQIVLQIDKLSITANTVTYAVAGDTIGYFKFFPSTEQSCVHVPAWGLATVVASDTTQIATGTRVYGFLPMSSFVVITPGNVSDRAFVDVAEHRKSLPAVYNNYTILTSDAWYEEQYEDEMIVFRPLFYTGFLLHDFIVSQGCFGARRVLITSASSKTSIALAFCLAQSPQAQGYAIVGLTSASNKTFVSSLGLYSQVVTYDELGSIATGEDAVMVDMAGSHNLTMQIHMLLQDKLKHSCAVGITHWETSAQPKAPLPGPKPVFFFAPAQFANARKNCETRGENLEDVVVGVWRRFLESTKSWYRSRRSVGPQQLVNGYGLVARGQLSPAEALVAEGLDETSSAGL